MTMNVTIVKGGSIFMSSLDLDKMFRLRFRMFRERLGWDVSSTDGREHDSFDALEPLYVLAKEGSAVVGCWRMLPTTGPNMLRDTFPELLAGTPAPDDERIWELSRFAVDTSNAVHSGGFGLSAVPIVMMRDAVIYARSQGVEVFVTVTTVAIERLLRQIGLKPRRLGPVIDIGVERTVALAFDTDSGTELALCAAAEKRRLADELAEAERTLPEGGPGVPPERG
jgi:acyl homoserine lactone synthase